MRGVRDEVGVTFDVAGIWNEAPYTRDYVMQFRAALDANGFSQTRIAAADGGGSIVKDMLSNASFAAAVQIVGVHSNPDAEDGRSVTVTLNKSCVCVYG